MTKFPPRTRILFPVKKLCCVRSVEADVASSGFVRHFQPRAEVEGERGRGARRKWCVTYRLMRFEGPFLRERPSRARRARSTPPTAQMCQQRVSVLPPPNSETESRTRRRADLALLAPTVPFQGGVCSRNNNGARGSPGRLPHHPPHALLNHIVPVRELTDELYDELVGPADTLLARASRCVVTHIARFHDDSVVPSSNARTLGHLPADLSQRVFDELVATRQLTAALVPDFAVATFAPQT